MVGGRWLVAFVFVTLSLPGCLDDPPEPPSGPSTGSLGTFAKGDHVALTFEGTGWFRGDWTASQHLNVRLSLAHDTIQDWCSFGAESDPLHVNGAFTAVAAFRGDTAPRDTGAAVVRIGQDATHQSTNSIKMPREDDCRTSHVFVVRAGEAVSLVVATSVPGLRVSLLDLQSEGPTQHLTVPLASRPGLLAVQPEATSDGGPELVVGRLEHASEWRQTIDVDSHWLVGLYWRDVTYLVPDPTGSLGHPGRSNYRYAFELVPVGQAADQTLPTSPPGGSGGSGPRTILSQLVSDAHGPHDLVFRHTETGVGSMDHEEGAWFVAVPYTHRG